MVCMPISLYNVHAAAAEAQGVFIYLGRHNSNQTSRKNLLVTFPIVLDHRDVEIFKRERC